MTYDPQDTSNFYLGVRLDIRIGTEFNDATAVENKPVYARVYGMDESETVRECDRDACVKDENFLSAFANSALSAIIRQSSCLLPTPFPYTLRI